MPAIAVRARMMMRSSPRAGLALPEKRRAVAYSILMVTRLAVACLVRRETRKT